jgi:hypothetical protein
MVEQRPVRRLPLMALAIVALFAGLWGALERLGFRLPAPQLLLPLAHGPLMVCGFLGTLISLERAVALGVASAYVAPLAAGLGALALIAGLPNPVGALLITLASAGLVWDFVLIIRKQAALFTITMAFGAVAWLAGNCMWLAGTPIPGMFFWWAGFLVLTIIGERLELSRLTGQTSLKRLTFVASLCVYVAGLIVASFNPAAGLRLLGAGMLLFTFWMLAYDVTRRTIRQTGLPRFVAISLLSGALWLGASGLMWLGFAGTVSFFRYDAMLHSVFLGYVFMMIFAHAPIIFPAVMSRPLPFRKVFYVHVALLHISLLLRIIDGDLAGAFWAYQWGGMLNVAALFLFLGSSAFAVVSGGRERARERAARSARASVKPGRIRA